MRSLALTLSTVVLFGACSSETGGDTATTSSSASSSSSASGTTGGTGQPCASVGDCPASTECITYTCPIDECVAEIAPAGTPIELGEVIGDCQKQVCGADGEPTSADDDADVPNDFNPCTDDGCSAGTPTQSSVSDFLPCGANNQLECIGGLCVGCNGDNACPPGGACHEPECVNNPNGICGLKIAEGKEVSNSDPADCFHAVCNAAGDIVVTPNVAEIPAPDANSCDVESCGEAGRVEHTSVEDGTACNDATFCDPKTCTGGACVSQPKPPADTPSATQTPGDCKLTICDGAGGEITVSDNTDVAPDAGGDCTHPICSGGTPGTAPNAAGSPCVGGLYNVCDASGNCT